MSFPRPLFPVETAFYPLLVMGLALLGDASLSKYVWMVSYAYVRVLFLEVLGVGARGFMIKVEERLLHGGQGCFTYYPGMGAGDYVRVGILGSRQGVFGFTERE